MKHVRYNELQKLILSDEGRFASNEREIESLQRRLTAMEKPDSKEESNPSPHRGQPPKAEIKKIKEIRGGIFNPRPTIVFEDDDTVNVWNYRAPFGNAIGNWKPEDSIALTRNFGGNGIDPDRATNLNQYDPDTNQHEAVNGNRRGNPCKMQ